MKNQKKNKQEENCCFFYSNQSYDQLMYDICKKEVRGTDKQTTREREDEEKS